ncbi:hypothetical protein AAEO56_17005 [Flavobacterium sp. DGU11]|uniref:Uncharacterized protein n=1 Tax=Flavobacterium arundinis TaxID=3139143 RepID=A0ABU9I0M4_9FLAO
MEGILNGAIKEILGFLISRKNKSKLQHQKSTTDIATLKGGQAVHEFELEIPYNDSSLSKIKQFLGEHRFSVIEDVDNGIIAYSHDSHKTSEKLWMQVDQFSLPLRVVCIRSLSGSISVRFDDNYGGRIVIKKIRQRFIDKYQPLFTYYEILLKKAFNLTTNVKSTENFNGMIQNNKP